MGKVIYILLFIVGSVLLARGKVTLTEDDCKMVPNCNSCENRKLECSDCKDKEALLVGGGGCQTCPLNCNKCEDTGNAGTPKIDCVECSDGFVLQTDKTCSACPDGCQYCNETTKCHQCYAPNPVNNKYYARASDFTCLECTTSCEACTVKETNVPFVTECTKCVKGKTVKTDKTCIGCPLNCDTCTYDGSTTICGVCATGYKLDSTNNKCLSCPSSCGDNCDGVARTGTIAKCTGCVDQYFLDADECKPCTTGCATCSTSSTNCGSCLAGYLLESTSCTPCPTACKTCELDAQMMPVCSVCNANYGIIAGDRACIACHDSRCTSCTAGPAVCNACDATYYVNGNKGCSACNVAPGQAGCTECSESGGTVTCSACATPGYFSPDSGATCRACSDATNGGLASCETCTYTGTTFTCATCATGSLPDGSTITACHSCPSTNPMCTNCVEASADTTCSGCSATHYLDTTCKACNVAPGHAGCSACTFASSAVTCTACATPGYYLDTGTCKECNDGMNGGLASCETCTKSGTFQCVTCAAGSLPDASTITMCHSYPGTGCTYASAASTCSDCAATHYLTSNNDCSACPANCAACSDTTGTCTSCSSGYYLDSNMACMQCGTHCATCADTTGECSACTSAAFTKDLSTPTVCVACVANCLSGMCAYDMTNSIVTCTKCNPGFERLQTTGVNDECKACPNGCATCPFTNGVAVCGTCVSRYNENTDDCGNCPLKCKKCTTVDGVIKCSANECDAGYALDSTLNECKPCPSNCKTCAVASDGTVLCSECNDAYGLSADKKSCTGCTALTGIGNCKECTDADSTGAATCKECNDAFTFNDDKSMCRACSELTNCFECEDEPWECKEGQCADTYVETDDDQCAHLCVKCDNCAAVDVMSNDTMYEPCFEGGCWAFFMGIDNSISRGCVENATCDATAMAENCDPITKNCAKCCEGNKCNTYPMTGMDAGAARVQLGFALLLSILLTMALRC